MKTDGGVKGAEVVVKNSGIIKHIKAKLTSEIQKTVKDTIEI